MHVLVSTSSRDSLQYEFNASGDFFKESRWQMLIMWACDCVYVCVCDAAMSLLQSRSEAATQADLGQTLRVTVTFKNNLPQSRKIDNIFVTFSGSPFPALCEPLCSYL